MNSDDRVVVTGTGVVSPLGIGAENFHQSLSEGKSGISTISIPWDTGYKTNRAGVIKDFELSRFMEIDNSETLGRTTRLALVACKMALEQAGFEKDAHPGSLGVVVGTAMGEAMEIERTFEAYSVVKGSGLDTETSGPLLPCPNVHDGIAIIFGLEGPCHLVSTTCAAGNHAIAWASDLLKLGHAEAMLAVGADTIGYVDLLGFTRLLLQAPDCCQPFDLYRKGTILSEGAGAILLEPLALAKRRGAPILAEVAGYGLSSDAAGAFASKATDVRSLKIAAERALKQARCRPEDIHYISAHGTGTRLNDAKETHFMKVLLGEHAYRVPVSSIKSMLGHCQGAAPTLEAIACVLSFKHNLLYPTINYQTPDPECDLDYVPNQAREWHGDTIMSNSFGMGGNNAIIILKQWKD